MRRAWLMWAICLSFLAGTAFAESGVMLRDDDLRASASAKAAASAKVAKGATVEILSTQSGWARVRHAGNTGWVRLLNVRRGVASQTDVAGGVASVLSMGAQRSDSSRVVATAGVRGLGVAELKAARFDAKQLERLESLGVPRADAERFATQAKLAARSVDYLPAPRPAADQNAAGDGGGGFDVMGGQ